MQGDVKAYDIYRVVQSRRPLRGGVVWHKILISSATDCADATYGGLLIARSEHTVGTPSSRLAARLAIWTIFPIVGFYATAVDYAYRQPDLV